MTGAETLNETPETPTETPVASEDADVPIRFTDEAAKRLKQEMEARGDGQVKALRMMVYPGGCAGLQYAMSFATKDPEEIETVLHDSGIDIYIEKQVVDLVRGAEVRWVDNLIGGGFQVVNPNAESTCGCGKSFC